MSEGGEVIALPATSLEPEDLLREAIGVCAEIRARKVTPQVIIFLIQEGGDPYISRSAVRVTDLCTAAVAMQAIAASTLYGDDDGLEP